MKTETMSLHEKLQITVKSIELEKAGKKEEAMHLAKSIPLSPYLAKFFKEWVGPDYLIDEGWNLADADAEFGRGWLDKGEQGTYYKKIRAQQSASRKKA